MSQSAFRRSLLQVYAALQQVAPEAAARFARDVGYFGQSLDLAKFDLEDFRVRSKPLKLREAALQGRAVLEAIVIDCAAIALHAAKESTEKPREKAGEKAAAAPSKRSAPAPPPSRAIVRAVAIEAEFTDSETARGTLQQMEMLFAGPPAPLALPPKRSR